MERQYSLRPRGLLTLYGEASGLVPPIDPRKLLFRKPLFLTRTGLDHYIADRRELRARTDGQKSSVTAGNRQANDRICLCFAFSGRIIDAMS